MNPALIALAIPIITLMIPIVAILTHHQQKMAAIIHNGQGAREVVSGEVEALRREIQELKSIVHQQAIAMDTFIDRHSKLAAPQSDIADRLSTK